MYPNESMRNSFGRAMSNYHSVSQESVEHTDAFPQQRGRESVSIPPHTKICKLF